MKRQILLFGSDQLLTKPMLFVLLFICITVLLMSFVCSLTEAVLLSLNPLALKVQQSKQGATSVAGRWLVMKNRIERPISAILIINTFANTGLATLAGAVFAQVFGDQWLWVFSIIISFAVLFVGELAPKILGVHHAERLAARLIGPLTWMVTLCLPLVALMERFCERLKSGPGEKQTKGDHIMDIITLVQSARAEQLLHNREEIIMIHAATLSAKRTKTAMVPRDAVRIFDQRKSLHENVAELGPKLHRSYPVSSDGTLEHLTGYVRVRELFVQHLADPENADWRQLIRQVLHIDEKASLTQLLTLFLEKQEIASLVDNPGGLITGWVTMDDVMKVLMGARI
jgi:CBS domain containing-hemolysin-like protein